jgi:hypothetical protein
LLDKVTVRWFAGHPGFHTVRREGDLDPGLATAGFDVSAFGFLLLADDAFGVDAEQYVGGVAGLVGNLGRARASCFDHHPARRT